jgi:hypothetical protein
MGAESCCVQKWKSLVHHRLLVELHSDLNKIRLRMTLFFKQEYLAQLLRFLYGCTFEPRCNPLNRGCFFDGLSVWLNMECNESDSNLPLCTVDLLVSESTWRCFRNGNHNVHHRTPRRIPLGFEQNSTEKCLSFQARIFGATASISLRVHSWTKMQEVLPLNRGCIFDELSVWLNMECNKSGSNLSLCMVEALAFDSAWALMFMWHPNSVKSKNRIANGHFTPPCSSWHLDCSPLKHLK